MQLGFVGLGKMGGNMVHRIHRDSDHTVVAFDFSVDAVRRPRATAPPAPRRCEELVSKLEAPRTSGSWCPRATRPRRRSTSSPSCSAGRPDRRRRQLAMDRRPAPRRARPPRASTTWTPATSGGVWGLQVGYCMMVGGPDEAVAAHGAHPRRPRPARDEEHGPGWNHFGPIGAGPLREDGPQRDRVRDHAGLRRGLRPLPRVRVRARQRQDRRACGSRARVVRSWLCELAAWPSSRRATSLEHIEGWVEDSGEGRWTVEEAIDKRVPMPVISESLYARFASRGQADFAARVNAALRNQFGGHAVKKV